MNAQPSSAMPTKGSSRPLTQYEPYVLLVLAAVFWAGNIIVGRLAGGHVPPLTLNWFRWSGAFILMLPFAWRHVRQDWPKLRGHWPIVAAIAATGYVICNSALYWGLQYTEALNALLIQSSGPLFVALSMLVLFGVRLSILQTIGISISLLGVAMIILRGDYSALGGITFNTGDILVTVGIGTFGLYSALLTRKPPAVHPLALLEVSIAIGAITLTPLAMWEWSIGRRLTVDPLTIGTLAFVAIFPSMLSYLFFNRGVQLIGANRAAPFLHLIPVFGSVMAIVFLGEQLRLFHVIGYALVLTGVYVAARKPSPSSQ